MSDVDLTAGAGLLGSSQAGRRGVQVYKIVYDASEKPITASDKVVLMTVGAGQLIRSVRLRVDVAEGSAANLNVGDSADPNGFISGADGNDASTDMVNSLTLTEASPNTVTGYSNGKFYSAQTDLQLTSSADLSTAMVTVFVEAVNLND